MIEKATYYSRISRLPFVIKQQVPYRGLTAATFSYLLPHSFMMEEAVASD